MTACCPCGTEQTKECHVFCCILINSTLVQRMFASRDYETNTTLVLRELPFYYNTEKDSAGGYRFYCCRNTIQRSRKTNYTVTPIVSNIGL